jgi:phosphoribosylglycinamide formyltransferase-1
MTVRIAVFASGSGSNLQALAEAVRDGRIAASIELVVCDKPSAYVLQRARAFGIDTYVFRPKEYSSREAYEEQILGELRKRGIDWIVMAGYMRLVSRVLVEPYDGRMINIHPALLPAFPGIWRPDHGCHRPLCRRWHGHRSDPRAADGRSAARRYGRDVVRAHSGGGA